MQDESTKNRILKSMTRRRFVKSASATAVLAGSVIVTPRSWAEELPRLSEDDPMAKALTYVHDAKSVEAAKGISDRYCNNCALFAGNADEEWAACSIFPGKAVAGLGWCSVWAPK